MIIYEFTEKELQGEEWRAVVGYEGVYIVSSLGRVKRVAEIPGKGRSSCKVLGLTRHPAGYAMVRLYLQGERGSWLVHRLVAAAFIGDCQAGMEVNHKNGIKADNRLNNLEYCTPRENILHSYRAGLRAPTEGERSGRRTKPEATAHGDRHGRTKIKDADVPRVFELRKKGLSYSRIAEVFGVSGTQIGTILSGKRRVTRGTEDECQKQN